ncbi:toxin-antitoxin system HicB family antitoxin [Streptomyces sp. NPDC058953]|uniref:toxin-antitoxin system HicB family antitoxin n=1 Tax=unclassified Streptomyces TaxID=2593676 RepID=UPI0036812431
MDLTPYVDTLHRELAVAAEVGGDDARELIERIAAPLEAATRLAMLGVLSAAMEEVSRELAPGSADVRLRGLEPDFVVNAPSAQDGATVEPLEPFVAQAAAEGDEGGTARVNLRLPAHLKARAEEAAGREGLSLNAWLVRAVATVAGGGSGTRSTGGSKTAGQSFTGWVR